MDIEKFMNSFNSGYLNKEHIDFILEDREILKQKLQQARQALILVRDESYRRTDDAKLLIKETLELTGH